MPHAQQFLLEAIENNTRDYLAVHVVLGSVVGSPDVVRARQLLVLALGSRQEMIMEPEARVLPHSCNLCVWSLNAADFLGQAKAEQIAEPFKFRDFAP